MRGLTLLTGLNGSGKSSVLQSLLLLRQSYKKQRLNTALALNGSLCSIGTGKDVFYQSAEDDFLSIAISESSDTYRWQFAPNGSKDFLPLQSDAIADVVLRKLSMFSNDFQYISAGRLPDLNYKRDDISVENERQLSLNKGNGELTAQFLYHWGKRININPALQNGNSYSLDLLNQVTAWGREISPNVNVIPRKIGESYTINYSFDKENSGSTEEFTTDNAAFGLTYALPVITAILSAEKGALLLIENPEAHLYPHSQSKLSELMALAAQNGIQLIVETHSDHIFNGVRKAIASKKIERENVSVHYFELDDTNTSFNTEISIADNGHILNHKKGLFDQFDDDLDELLGINASKRKTTVKEEAERS
jgi:predicted ATPase